MRTELIVAIILTCGTILTGCGRRDSSGGADGGSGTASGFRFDARTKPTLEFPKRVECDEPGVNEFLREFYEACCRDNYDKFRLMMSTHVDPFAPDRFKKALQAVEVVQIVSIELLPDVADVPPPIYLIRSDIRLRENVRKAEREKTIAILVFKEAGKWVMVPAPAELRGGLDALYEEEGEATDGGEKSGQDKHPADAEEPSGAT